MDENRKKNKVSENPKLIKKILGPLGFTDIARNTQNRGTDNAKKGFDFNAKKGRIKVKIEVKASTFDKNGKIKGIPDAVGTEFTDVKIRGRPKFKADYLLVIGLKSSDPYQAKKAYLVTKEVVNTYDHTVKPMVVFSSELKTKLRNAEKSDKEIKIIALNRKKCEVR